MSYSYDGDGNRRSKGVVVGLGYTLDVNRALPVVVTDVENKYVWGASLTHARGPLGSVTVEGNTVPLQLGVVHADGLGSVRALTSEDGSVFQTYRTDEFGVPITTDSLGASLQPFQFTGEQRDLETGFVYLRARYYAPDIGRFMTRDRWPGIRNVPLTLNRDSYVGNNPVRFVDASGYLFADGSSADRSRLDAGPISGNFLPGAQLPFGPQERSRLLNPFPDYLRLTGNIAIPNPLSGTLVGVSASVAIDRFFRVYLGGGASFGRTATFASASAAAGYLLQGDIPSPTELSSLLTGPSVSVGGGFIVGGDVTYSPFASGTRLGVEVGLFSPQLGVNVTYSEQVFALEPWLTP